MTRASRPVNLSDPGLVRRVHEDYVRAGADVLITNTFMSGLGPMERAGEGERFALANRNAVAAARAATDSAGRPIVIAGSVSATQLGARETGPAPGGNEHHRLRDGYARQIELLAQEGVDLIAPSWRFLDLPPERFTELARGWRAAGVSMIGGCCGIGPSQIAALAGLSA